MDTKNSSDTMKPVDEYKALRDDLLYVLKSRDQFLLFTLVVTAAIWGWAATQNFTGNTNSESSFLFLLPLAVIIPNMFYYAAQVRTGQKIGSYLHVFHEIKKPGWERRSGDFNKLPNDFKSPHNSYTLSFPLLGSICIILFIVKGDCILTPEFIMGAIAIFGLCALILAINKRLELTNQIISSQISYAALGLICIILLIWKSYYEQTLVFISGAISASSIVFLCCAQRTLSKSFDQYEHHLYNWRVVDGNEKNRPEKPETQPEIHNIHQEGLIFRVIVAVIILAIAIGVWLQWLKPEYIIH